jgi:F0F1-type ATP synthase assembly protein I
VKLPPRTTTTTNRTANPSTNPTANPTTNPTTAGTSHRSIAGAVARTVTRTAGGSVDRRIKTDDTVGKGMDLALTSLLFLGIGYGLDRWLGTKPVLMIVLTLLALVGKGAGMYYAYQEKMSALDVERAASRHDRPRSTYVVADEPVDAGAGIRPEQFS